MSASDRKKGAVAERQVVRLLNEHGFNVKRNLQQTRDGGADIIIGELISLEVKRQERSALPTWWAQALKQAEGKYVPALAWRRSYTDWQFWTELPTRHNSRTLEQFVAWAKSQLAGASLNEN